jgi:hypothetical protein
MASIQARHTRACALGDTYRAPGAEGCTSCEPTLFVIVRQGPRTIPHRAGKNLKVAKRLLAKLQVREGSDRSNARVGALGCRRETQSTVTLKPDQTFVRFGNAGRDVRCERDDLARRRRMLPLVRSPD